MIQLWKQREEWGKTINPNAYCVTLLKRRCVDKLRRQHPTSPIDEEALMMVEDVDDNLEERYQQARQLVDKLPDRQRDVILMKYEQGLDNKEIEKTLRMSSTHVYATLSRAYKNLREAFDRDRHCP